MNLFELRIILALLFTSPSQDASSLWVEGEYLKLNHHPAITIDTCGQKLMLLSFQIRPGFHIMSNTVENENFLTTELTLAGTNQIEFGPAEFPPPTEKKLQGAAAGVRVFSGSFLVKVPVSVASMASQCVVHPLKGVLFYQACDETKCYFPRTLTFNLTVKTE